MGCAFLASSTLRTAIFRLVRYARVIDDVAVFEIKEDNKHLVLSLTRDNPYSFPETAGEEDATWALVLSLCRSGCGDQLAPLQVRLLHQDFDSRVAYDDFFQCLVTFNAKKSEVIFARADVDRPFPAPNREIAKANDKILQRYLEQLQQDDLIDRVKTAIADELPSGTLTDERIAKAVFMSPRSLRRRLLNIRVHRTRNCPKPAKRGLTKPAL